MKKRLSTTFVAVAASAALLAACGGNGGESTSDATTTPATGSEVDAETQALIDEASAAGAVTFYSMIDEAALRTVSEAFTEKYGVEVSPLRLVSGDLTQRFAAEAASGNATADVILLTHSPFFQEALESEWLTALPDLGLPSSAETVPDDFVENDGAVPVVSLIPTEAVINSDLVAEPLAAWTDYADPAYRGQLMLAEPDSSPANAAFWSLMREEFGDEFLEDVAANEPRWGAGAVPITQAVAAGETNLGHPGVAAIVTNLQGQGAPVELVSLSPTTGPEAAVGVSASSSNPAGGKLMALFLMSEEGNTLLNDETTAISPFDASALERFTRVKDIANVDMEGIKTLLGR